MILELIRGRLEAEAEKRGPGKGNPTGSALGHCAAQMQHLIYRDLTAPEPLQSRSIATFDFGDMVADWLDKKIGAALEDRMKALGAARPNTLWGLREQSFYFPVPWDETMVADVLADQGYGAGDTWTIASQEFAAKVGERLDDRSRRLWGTVVRGFTRPSIKLRVGQDGRPRPVLAGIGQGKDWRGLCLDVDTKTLWVPTQVDGVFLDPTHGLVVVEKKSMSNFAFRRAVLGVLDYSYCCQLVGVLVATGFDAAVWVLVRKETGHLAEVLFTRGDQEIQVRLTGPNGFAEVYTVADPNKGTLRHAEPDGSETTVDLDAIKEMWTEAATWTPYDPSILPELYARVWRAVLARPGKWYREAGPDFTCRKCGGLGTKVCGQCKGTGVTPKLGKSCGPCGGATKVSCKACGGAGQLDEVALPPMPCAYCPAKMACWAPAGVRAEISASTKPRWVVTRSGFLASGIRFTPPSSTVVQVVPDVEEDAAVDVDA